MNSSGLSPVSPVPFDLENALGLSIFILVSPDHSVRTNYTGGPIVYDGLLPFFPRVSSVVCVCMYIYIYTYTLHTHKMCVTKGTVVLTLVYCYLVRISKSSLSTASFIQI
jgi:hypothetical protein